MSEQSDSLEIALFGKIGTVGGQRILRILQAAGWRPPVPADHPTEPDVAEQIRLLWDYRTNQGYAFLNFTEDVRVMRELLVGKALREVAGFEWLAEAERRHAEMAEEDAAELVRVEPTTDPQPDTARAALENATTTLTEDAAYIKRIEAALDVAETALATAQADAFDEGHKRGFYHNHPRDFINPYRATATTEKDS